jgi:4-amino-4-deoxy-L-arabinose transferase-like glycosyltransferase
MQMSSSPFQDRAVLLVLLVLAAFFMVNNPLGYFGGNWDDGRYAHMIMEWVTRGPVIGTNHWGLRWPVVLPAVASVEAFGVTRAALMVSPIIFVTTLIMFNFWAARHFLGLAAAAVGTAAIVTTPEIMIWGTRLNPDVPEVLFWSMALWSFALAREASIAGAVRRARNWLIIAGLSAGLAWATRETSLGLVLVFGAAFLAGVGVPRWSFGWIAAGFGLIAIPEMLILWDATGDPLYRLHVDLNHTQIHSHDIKGGVTPGQIAPLNPDVMNRWEGAGPIRLHWAFDPWINFFANYKFGLAFLMAGGLWFAAQRQMSREDRRIMIALLIVILINILTNLYVANTDPKVRMFMPAIVAACIAIGWCAVRVVGAKGRRILITLFVFKFLATFVYTDLKANFTGATELVGAALQSVDGPVYANRQAMAHIILIDPKLKARVRLGIAPVGGTQLTVGVRRDIEGQEPPPAGRTWHALWQRSTDQMPLTWRLIAPVRKWLKLKDAARYKAVQVSLYRHIVPTDH